MLFGKGADGCKATVISTDMADILATLEQPQTRPHKRSTEGFAPRYTVIEEGVGFRVEGKDRDAVFVRLSPGKTHFLIGRTREVVNTSEEEDVDGQFHCGLYGYYRLLDTLARLTMFHWKRPPNAPNAWSGIQTWALDRTRRALHYRGVYQHWQRLLSLVPEHVQRVAKAVFATTFDGARCGCETWPELYDYPFLVKDVVQYRAAAIAAHYAEEMIDTVGLLIGAQRTSPTFQAGLFAERFGIFSERQKSDLFDAEASPLPMQTAAQRRSEVLEILAHDWKALYSGSAKPGKSLRRTLMNVPGGISGRLLQALPRLDHFLVRPITDRVELTTFLLLAHVFLGSQPAPEEAWEGKILARASRKEILTALRLLSQERQRDFRRQGLEGPPALTPWKSGLSVLVGYLHDYCRYCRDVGRAAHTGGIVGLMEKSIEWHRDAQRLAEEHQKALFDGTAQAAPPPISLPDDPAISFLATAKDIFAEGEHMKHCIASFASWAVQGGCYLFHVNFQGTEASVHVHPTGYVVQSYGPYNCTNAASEYGRQALEQWGRAFRRQPMGQMQAIFVEPGAWGNDLRDLDEPF